MTIQTYTTTGSVSKDLFFSSLRSFSEGENSLWAYELWYKNEFLGFLGTVSGSLSEAEKSYSMCDDVLSWAVA